MLADPEPVVRQKLKTMVTDPARVRRSDPGNPDVCPVGDLHKIFSERDTMAKVYEGCRSAGIGCIECKSWVADALVNILNPMQERRKKYEENPRLAWDILEAGSARARQVAEATMTEVREAMGMSLDYEPPRDECRLRSRKWAKNAKSAFDGTAALDLGPTLVENAAPRVEEKPRER